MRKRIVLPVRLSMSDALALARRAWGWRGWVRACGSTCQVGQRFEQGVGTPYRFVSLGKGDSWEAAFQSAGIASLATK
jgi:hypothetical protein